MQIKAKNLLVVLFFTALIVLQSCSTEPGLAEVSVVMKATTSNSSITAGRLASTGLEFTDVQIGVEEMEFETLEEDESEENDDFEDSDSDGEHDDDDIEFEGKYVVDLIDGTSVPEFGIADLPPGLYEEMEVELGPILEGGNTVFIAFNYTPSGATDPIRYEYSNKYEIEFEFEDESGFIIDEGLVNQILIILDLDALFTDVDLNTANVDTDGIVRINLTSNSDLALEIAGNLESAMDCDEDEDGDGEIDDD